MVRLTVISGFVIALIGCGVATAQEMYEIGLKCPAEEDGTPEWTLAYNRKDIVVVRIRNINSKVPEVSTRYPPGTRYSVRSWWLSPPRTGTRSAPSR